MSTTVTLAQPGDVDAIAGLLAELAEYYGTGVVESPGQRVAQITAALFGDAPTGSALLARVDGEVAGMAAYSFLWPAIGSTRSLYLKELYVATAHRRSGIGKLLMDALFDTAARLGCSRVEWTTDQPNVGAQRFYERLGTRVHPTKLFYRAEL